MAQPLVGEVRMFAGNFAPAGWMSCDGRLISIAENDVLFQLIGTTYGGDGQETFAVPDFRGRVPVNNGNGYLIGQVSGDEQVTLNISQIPAHNHAIVASSSIANAANPANNILAVSSQLGTFTGINDLTNMNNSNMAVTGGSQPHDNMQPTLCITFIISLYGVFPSQY